MTQANQLNPLKLNALANRLEERADYLFSLTRLKALKLHRAVKVTRELQHVKKAGRTAITDYNHVALRHLTAARQGAILRVRASKLRYAAARLQAGGEAPPGTLALYRRYLTFSKDS